MTAIERVNELKEQAIAILLAEREEIDSHLAQLGYGKIKTAPMKKRGRPTKQLLPSVQSDTTQPILS